MENECIKMEIKGKEERVMDNRTMIQYFEWYLPSDHTLWKKVAKEAANLKEAGITSVWLPPAYKGALGANDVGYAVYDTYDLGEFDQKGSIPTKYGTKDEYLQAIKSLQEQGIEVLADIVLGHRLGADEKERIFAYGSASDDRNRQTCDKKKVTVWTKFTFPGRNGKYSDFKWDWTNFHGTDYDAHSKENGILKFIGKDWDQDVDSENGNFDYLMGVDLDMSDPEVLEELDRWGEWYLNFTGVDGFRIDAVKHIEFHFFKVWLEKLRKSSGKELFAVGEYWNAELSRLQNYIEKSARALSLFDVPLHFHMFDASRSNGTYDMRNLFKDTLVEADPELAVTFVDNHDTQYGQALESWILDWFKPMAYALILLREKGYPCVFYGDYYGVPNNNLPPVAELPKLMELRKNVAYGEQVDYFDDPSMVGWVRCGDEEHDPSGLVVLMTIGAGGTKKMFVGEEKAGMVYEDVMEKVADTVVIGKDGYGEFLVKDGSMSIWMPNGEKVEAAELEELEKKKEESREEKEQREGNEV